MSDTIPPECYVSVCFARFPSVFRPPVYFFLLKLHSAHRMPASPCGESVGPRVSWPSGLAYRAFLCSCVADRLFAALFSLMGWSFGLGLVRGSCNRAFVELAHNRCMCPRCRFVWNMRVHRMSSQWGKTWGFSLHRGRKRMEKETKSEISRKSIFLNKLDPNFVYKTLILFIAFDYKICDEKNFVDV